MKSSRELWLELYDDTGETLRARTEFFVPSRHTTDREHVGDHIDILLITQRVRIVFWHGCSRVLEEGGE